MIVYRHEKERLGEKDFFRAVLLSGPPGIGKTSSALAVCKDLGFQAIEFNASDTRSKKALEVFPIKNTIKLQALNRISNCESEPIP